MLKITSREFKNAIKDDPSWAKNIKEDFEITTYCDMDNSKITHLSPHLHFTGKNSIGAVASFEWCKNLKVAEGNFTGHVNFSSSGVEKINREGLKITELSKSGKAASFFFCLNLKVATGTFPGFVNFKHSYIEKIDKLDILAPTYSKFKANFEDCKKLKINPQIKKLLEPEYQISKDLEKKLLLLIENKETDIKL